MPKPLKVSEPVSEMIECNEGMKLRAPISWRGLRAIAKGHTEKIALRGIIVLNNRYGHRLASYLNAAFGKSRRAQTLVADRL